MLLKESAIIIPKLLTLFFNTSLNMGLFPDQWKFANLFPIHKGKETRLVNNFRPISCLSCLGKTFEHLSSVIAKAFTRIDISRALKFKLDIST